ncbi:MAG: tagaturonate reductase [Saprospiraceae bacterium]|nr:tagaturonate reductase [Saprospiraceae bacterium]
MNILNKKYAVETLKIPSERFDLPERIMQFGTGVLLRGLCDYTVDKANKNGVFNGRIVVVKSTSSDSSDFDRQDSIYTLQQKGIAETGEIINNATVLTAINRVVDATTQWEEVLKCAINPTIDIVISNTTEAGLVYLHEDIFGTPPQSFPAKLTAVLYERFSAFDGAETGGMTIVPTELIVENGKLLRGYVVRHAEANDLPQSFIEWLDVACDFCDSLVDRIVSGAPSKDEKERRFTEDYQYRDELCIDSEPFLLWAIQGNERVKQRLSFAQTDNRVVITEDIAPFKEQKLRILNGGHTISINAAFLAGHEFVRDMMSDSLCGRLSEQVILKEILPTVTPICSDAPNFANAVLNRFRNPFIAHKLIGITFQNSAKMLARNAETFKRYYAQTGQIPQLMSLGFAAYLLFSKVAKVENGKYFGKITEGSNFYPMTDDKAGILQKKWAGIGGSTDKNSLLAFVQSVMSDAELFGNSALNDLPIAEVIADYLFQLMNLGVKKTVEKALD